MPYTEEQKAEAVELAQEVGTSEASRRTGASATSIKRWTADAGLTDQTKREKTEAAREQLAIQRAKKREDLRNLLLDKALDLLGRMDEEHKDYRGKDVTAVYWDKAPSGATKDYATAAAILIDKFRLEMGEATGRTEVHGDLDREIASRLGEWERQLAAND